MPQVNKEYVQFRGLQFGVDRKRIAEPYCADGRNFFVDVDGPVSGFGKTWQIHQGIEEPRGVQTLYNNDEDDVYIFVGDSIVSYDQDSRQLVVHYRHATRTLWWPWTRARVGTHLYFCNKEVGIIRFCTISGTREAVTGANVPSDPIAICESGGRLFVLSETAVTWSAIDDGSNSGLAPSTATGAGSQSLVILSANPRPMMCLPYSDGVLSYTAVGILRSELRESTPNPFRHRPLSRSHYILNPWCVTSLVNETAGQSIVGADEGTESHVFLTKRGFFQTDGRQRPTPWQPLASEYMQRNLLPTLTVNSPNDIVVRIDSILERNLVMVSYSRTSTKAVFSNALCLYIPTKEWGIFNEAHTGFGELKVGADRLRSAVFGVDGTVSTFDFSDASNVYPVTDLFHVDLKHAAEYPAQYEPNAVTIMADQCVMHHIDPTYIDNPGVYDLRTELTERFSPLEMPDVPDADDEDPVEGEVSATPSTYTMRNGMAVQTALLRTAIGPLAPIANALNSEVLVGPIKFSGDDSIPTDVLVQMQEAIIGMLDTGLDDEFEDYIDDYPGEDENFDWNTLTGNEDWGTSAGDLTEYSVQFEGTIDGYAIWTVNNIQQLKVPDLVEQMGRTRHVAGTVVGQYVFLRISAKNVGESFHLKHLKAALASAGRVF